MKLAEMLNTSTSYIGEIEINRKVPSLEMVEKIARALKVEPFRLFVDNRNLGEGNAPPPGAYLGALTTAERRDLAERLVALISQDVGQLLQPEKDVPRP